LAGQPTISVDLLLEAYAAGVFPMSDSADDPDLYWVEPRRRGVLPLDRFHLGRRLARTVRSDRFEVSVDRDFEAVIDGCAAPAPGREGTWINREIRRLYGELFRLGRVHTVESRLGGALVGGLYGVRIGGAFFGESMFSTVTDASKVALVHLVARLRIGGFVLLDTQFLTDHLARFGTVEISRRAYRAALAAAIPIPADFHRLSPPATAVDGHTAVEAVLAGRAAPETS
jgi:leucyl/phenylalanyl-tRNA--protein transferase